MRRLMILLTFLISACGGPTQSPENVEAESTTTGEGMDDSGGSERMDVAGSDGGDGAGPQGTEEIQPDEGDCPATMKEAKGNCLTPEGEKIPKICKYSEGTCKCGPPKHCGGMPPDPEAMEEWVWTCKSPPPDVLPDGCPGKLPEPGASCDDEGKVCWHGSCCTQKIECSKGKWLVGDLKCPP